MDAYKWVRWVRLPATLLLITALVGCTSPAAPGGEPPRAEAGTLDLGEWSVEDRGPVRLDGTWEFRWRQLLTPADFGRSPGPDRRASIRVPGVWAGQAPYGDPLPGHGYATYRLVIRDPAAGGVRALNLPVIRTAYRLWVNGQLLAASGQVGKTRAQTIPRYRTQVIDFQSQGDTLELVLQVANFHHRAGGIHNPLIYGTPNQITGIHERRVAFSLFLFGSLLILGLYQLGFYAVRRQEPSTLYLGLFCLLVALWTLLVREAFLTRLFPNFPWEAGMKLEYLAIYAGLPLFALFLRSLYPDEVSQRVTATIAGLGLLFSLAVLVTPATVYTRTLPVFQAIMILAAIYLLYALILATVRTRPGAWLSLLAGAVFSATVCNDILFVDGIIHTGELAPLGLLFFVFAQATILSTNYARALVQVQQLSADLKEINRTLERKVAERTRSLEQSQRQESETRAAISVIQERERIAREIHNSVGHALTTTIVLIEAAKRLFGRDSALAGEKLAQSQDLVRKGLNEVRQAVHALKAAPWEIDLGHALKQLIHETTMHTDTLVETDIQPLCGVTPAQREVLYQALQEGLTNGLRHGMSTHFQFSLCHDDRDIHFTLIDNGQGASECNFGFGLQSLRECVLELDGSMAVDTAPGKGFTLSVSLPVHLPD